MPKKPNPPPRSCRDDLDEMLERVWGCRRYDIDIVSHTADEVTVTLRRQGTRRPAGFDLARVPRRRRS